MMPRPPTSTLFPYTTLFRSRSSEVETLVNTMSQPARAAAESTIDAAAALAGCDIDRKSTRLNSSHVSISYAVFCLKKKNKDSCHLLEQGEAVVAKIS